MRLQSAHIVGSSPHARGAQCKAAYIRVSAGVIPACAGSTLFLSFWVMMCRGHPRMRGEHSVPQGVECPRGGHPRMRGEHHVTLVSILSERGSSPHARGALVVLQIPKPGAGVIPACAGSTATSRAVNNCSWGHPRMRGEHEVISDYSGATMGSSPHARGAHGVMSRCPAPSGVIPACAGSTVLV